MLRRIEIKSDFLGRPEEAIQLDFFVELVIKIVETHYQLKSKKKAITSFERSTNYSDSPSSPKPPSF
jgi:hypothetical protein